MLPPDLPPTSRARDFGRLIVRLVLPWPPSVNRYWRSVKGRVLISADGRKYRAAVVASVLSGRAVPMGSHPVAVAIDAYYPDRRRRDIDNVLKAPLDALTAAGMWEDDSQVQALSIRKAGIDQGNPRLEITLEAA